MQLVMDSEFRYFGISFEERLAIRHLFNNDEDFIGKAEVIPDQSLQERPLQ